MISNVYVETFSKDNLIKTELRNLLDVSTVSFILLLIKIFYENDDGFFEPKEIIIYAINIGLRIGKVLYRKHSYSSEF